MLEGTPPTNAGSTSASTASTSWRFAASKTATRISRVSTRRSLATAAERLVLLLFLLLVCLREGSLRGRSCARGDPTVERVVGNAGVHAVLGRRAARVAPRHDTDLCKGAGEVAGHRREQ